MNEMALLSRLALVLCAFACLAQPCDCAGNMTVGKAKKYAEVVFRGTITGFRKSDSGESLVVFRVTRVWKGAVSETFEMPALKEGAACIGFWPSFLSVGNDLLVYASQQGSPAAYFTSICTRTSLAKDAEEDFQKLGQGRAPKSH